jgi:hypothetical protein
MTTPGSGELFTLLPSRSRVGGSVGKASWKMGCALVVLCAAIASAQTFRTVARFNVPYVFPESPLVQGLDGNFYGTTMHSVVQNGPRQVFKVTPDGMLTTVNNSLGGSPTGALVQTADGDLYGTTFGTVFKLTPGGTLTTLLNFCFLDPNCTYGFEATGPLLQGNDGNFYGETGSPNVPCIGPCATIFKITPTGTLTTLVTFDVDVPIALSFQDTDGNFMEQLGGSAVPTARAQSSGSLRAVP